jgi:hypothetical protein
MFPMHTFVEGYAAQEREPVVPNRLARVNVKYSCLSISTTVKHDSILLKSSLSVHVLVDAKSFMHMEILHGAEFSCMSEMSSRTGALDSALGLICMPTL